MADKKELWWNVDTQKETAAAVFSAMDTIKRNDGNRRLKYKAFEAIYADVHSEHFGEVGYWRDGKSKMPVLPGMVDATLSRIGRGRPLPMVLTDGGDFDAQQRAKRKTTWLRGKFKEQDVHTTSREVLRDAVVLGTGVCKPYYDEETDQIVNEQVYPGDVFVHRREAWHNRVRTYYQRAVVDREALLAAYPGKAKAIREAKEADSREEDVGDEMTDMVEVIEAWRLGTGDKPGKHVICVESDCLFVEDWTRKSPFRFIRWRKVQRKFWGVGMVEGGAALQSMIDKTIRTMEECFRLSFPVILYQRGSGFDAEQLTNAPHVAYPVDNLGAVQWLTPQPFADSYYKYLQMLKTQLFETQGVSELAASSSKPAGLNSGKALLVFQDAESERFLIQGREFEDMHVGLAEDFIEIAEWVTENKPNSKALKAIGGDKKALEAIEYKDVRFQDKPWEVQVFPVTSLSHTPSGRLAQVQEFIQSGIVTDPAKARELLDFPDFKRENDLDGADRERVDKTLQRVLDTADVTEMEVADPYMDLDYAHRRGLQIYSDAHVNGASEKQLEALRDFLGSVVNEKQQREKKLMEREAAMQAAAGAAAGPMAPQVPPPVPPGPAPTPMVPGGM